MLPMLPKSLKRLARIVPYARRAIDGVEGMRAHIAALEARLAAPSRLWGTTPNNGLEAVYFIDQCWCDTEGVYVEGWVHAGADLVRHVALSCDGHRAEATLLATRPDVVSHYPHIPASGAAGFSAYLACPACKPLMLEIGTDHGTRTVAIDLPAPPGRPDPPDATLATQAFVDAMHARRGTVLELGARIVGTMTQGWRDRFEPTCTYLGNDIHPGPGIDIVGDVHALSAQVAPGSLDGLFSVAVLEHLAAPWVAATEISRCLRLGGETLHVTHQTWPVHETPNDFFRMSDQALRSLFGPAHGFEVITCGMALPVAIVPPPSIRHADWLRIPFGRGLGQSYIHARKVAEPQAWGTNDLRQRSEAYPTPV